MERAARSVEKKRCVDDPPVYVELVLFVSTIADAYRCTALVPRNSNGDGFGWRLLPVDVVKDPYSGATQPARVEQPVHERDCELAAAGREEAGETYGRIARQRVAMSTVAVTSDLFWQGRRGVCHRSAGGTVGEEAKRQEAPHHCSPAWSLVLDRAGPSLPPVDLQSQ